MNEFFSILGSSWRYMYEVPLFWGTVGFTVAIAMFVGAIVYDGNVDEIKKTIISVFSYALMLFWMAVLQIFDARIRHPEILTEFVKPTTYVIALNVIVTTIAWLLGIWLGVITVFVKKERHKKLKLSLS